MSGFAKIFASMLRSTVWVGQPWHVKLTWITLLMLADAEGNVWASVPGLARDAEVTLEQCEQALALFMAPDRHSRTKAHEGRRIVEIDGGWHILNHLKYRELQTRKQALHAKRQRDYYERKKGKQTGFDVVAADVSSVSADAPDAQTAAEAVVYGSNAPKATRRRKSQVVEIPHAGVSADAADDFAASASVSDQSLGDPDQSDPDPDPIPSDPAKDGSARARPSGVFDAPLHPGKVLDVPASWKGPKPAHIAYATDFALNVDDEAETFRLTHFQAPFPGSEVGVDRRFMLWLKKARNDAETTRGKAFAQQQAAGNGSGVRRGRMPTNGVAALQPDAGRTGFEALTLPEPEPAPERPRRAARR